MVRGNQKNGSLTLFTNYSLVEVVEQVQSQSLSSNLGQSQLAVTINTEGRRTSTSDRQVRASRVHLSVRPLTAVTPLTTRSECEQ